MNGNDKRLIEDYLPIEAISAEASREKSVRKGHISTLHLWWARRPLVACRAAVYGALVPASRFVPENGPDEKKRSLGRANSARFVKALCQYPKASDPTQTAAVNRTVQEAQRHILVAHAERLTQELVEWKNEKTDKPGWVDEFSFTGEKVTTEDIAAGRAPRPRVLDMFAGGGAIPLEALRLGCEAYANDLNPVAHIIQLCTLVYPQKYGKPDPNARGMTGPEDEEGNPTWGGLADEVRYWGNWVLKKVKVEIGDLYPLIPDPEYKGKRPPIKLDPETGEWVISRKPGKVRKDDPFAPPQGVMGFAEDAQLRLSSQAEAVNHKVDLPPGYLMPVAYLWTRTVKCKNPACGATVPLVKQTWLCKKKDHYVAMKMIAPQGKKEVRFEVVEARSEKALGFDPTGFSARGNAACPFCGAVADSDYVKDEGCASRVGQQLMAIACTRPGERGKCYVTFEDAPRAIPSQTSIEERVETLSTDAGLTVPRESIGNDAKNANFCILYGITTFADLFSSRQALALLTFCHACRRAEESMNCADMEHQRTVALATCLGMLVDRLAVYSSTQCVWHCLKGERTAKTFGRQALPMTWDYSESSPLNQESASWPVALEWLVPGLDGVYVGSAADARRGSALALPWQEQSVDAVVTDPPYYDNVPYANISDYFYVWLKRTVGHNYPEHFAAQGTPKKAEAVADATRHGGDRPRAAKAYEDMIAGSLAEAHRVLKPSGQLTMVYAHKTTLGWTTLVDALRNAGFTVTEAWPLDTEMRSRLRGRDSAALASSIFLVARKRNGDPTAGNYEEDVVPELAGIVRERVDTLWEMGISGADLVIACVGAGLRAFTKYGRVEFANGEEVPAERFLTEVETVVLETILGKLSKKVGSKDGTSLAGVDPATRFYVLWRYTYGWAELDAGEAIIFANGTHVELDGQHSLTAGKHALLEKKKSKYCLLDFADRGKDEDLGMPTEDGTAAPAVDALHRLLWLVEKKPPLIPEFLNEAKPNLEQLRLVAQALAGPALKGGELATVSPTAEQSALGKLLANWNSVMVGKAATADKRAGQQQLEI